ncbi:MAG: acyl-CoA dehydrogenase family protein [Chloroflexi bacterium]|nr:acyl-CoA dehydrogenase family protein [Chloroflexota bacterium]
MDFALSDQEKMLQAVAKEFAVKSVQPRAAEVDRSGEFPVDLAREMGRRGYYGLPYPSRYGGSGAAYLGHVLVLEQVCQASMTAGAIMAINTVPEEAVFIFGNEEQKEAFLVPLAQGRLLGGIAFTEAETGSDPKAITTLARKSGSGYVITGEKHFVAMAPALNLVLLFARREGAGLNAFIVDTSSPGFIVRAPYDTMGLRGLGTSVVELDGVYVPQENLLGKGGQGFDILLRVMNLARMSVAVEGIAVAQSALELSLEYARQRKALGKPIAEMPSIQWHLAEMAARIEAGRWLAYRTAFLRDQGQDIGYESSVAKLFASQTAVEVTRMAMQVHGSYGTTRAMPVERLYRDAKMTEIYVGVSEIQRSIIAGHLLGKRRSK